MENYYIIAFNTEIRDPFDPVAHIGMEAFAYIGNTIEYFEEQMGLPDRLPKNHGSIIHAIKLKKTMNPHRHIRIYGIKCSIEPEEFRAYCEICAADAEKMIMRAGIVI